MHARRLPPPREARSGASRRNFFRSTLNTLRFECRMSGDIPHAQRRSRVERQWNHAQRRSRVERHWNHAQRRSRVERKGKTRSQRSRIEHKGKTRSQRSVLSAKGKLRARFDAASRLTNLPRAVKRTGRAVRSLTLFCIFYENARGRAAGRAAAKARARHLCTDTQREALILRPSKDWKCRSFEDLQPAQRRSRVERQWNHAQRRSRVERKGKTRDA